MTRPHRAPVAQNGILGPQKLEEGKDPHPQDKIQHLDFTKDHPAALLQDPSVHFTTKMSVVRPFSVLSEDEIGP